jgi:hypothetical protein
MLASMEPLDDDPLAFLSLDIRMPGVYDWGFGDQDFNMFKRSTPLAATTVTAAGVTARWSTSRSASGGTALTPLCPVDWGSGETRRRGYWTRERGGRGRTACMASRRRSRMGSQTLRPG